jgi:hypothetical protein
VNAINFHPPKSDVLGTSTRHFCGTLAWQHHFSNLGSIHGILNDVAQFHNGANNFTPAQSKKQRLKKQPYWKSGSPDQLKPVY